ncbi:MAG: ATPase [Pontixanthobacter sp.]
MADDISEEMDSALTLDNEIVEDWDYEDRPKRSFGWVGSALAILAAAGWTGFFGWTNQYDILAGGTPQQWIGWITSWAVPMLLITTLCILAMRNSTREAHRFGLIANTLSQESSLLETRLTTVNRELSLAREFLGAQSLELDSIGRMASERLSEHANNLQSLVNANGAQIDSIASVSGIALENMGKLRDDLPVIANSAKDVSNQIGTAGRTAHGQIAELIAGFERLNQFGKASEAQVGSIQAKIDAALGAFEAQTEAMEQLAEERFGALKNKSESFRSNLDSREVEVLAAMRRRAEALESEFSQTRAVLESEEEEALRSLRARLSGLRDEAGIIGNSVAQNEEAALGIWHSRVETLKQQLLEAIGEIQRIDEQALDAANAKLETLRLEAEAVDANIEARDAHLYEKIEMRRKVLAANEAASLSALTQRFEALDSEISSRNEAHLVGAETLAQRSEAIAERIGSLRSAIEEIAALGTETQAGMTHHAEDLAAALQQSRDSISGTDQAVSNLTDASVRLLELIQASAQHSSVNLPEALGTAEARLLQVKDKAEGLKSIVASAGERTEELSNYVLKAQQDSHQSIQDVDALRGRVAASNAETHEAIVLMRTDLKSLAEQSDILSGKAQDQLRGVIETLEEAVRAAPTSLEEGVADKIEQIAAKLGETTSVVLSQTLENATNASISRIEESTDKANKAGRETTVQLRDQLVKVNELAANLENRVARARERAEEQVGNDFARRVALITESLNSNSIDIAKALSSDVTDTAWASYLRGDRGIFTRRAVRLLDNTEARDIAEIYDAEPEFRENVSRYIHDFEAMLRSMLSTRDGNALGVTLLSSDMGKLYVALAQAIERLRE